MAPITRYATEADMALFAVNEEALRGVESSQIEAALEAASRLADDYISAQYALPLQQISTSLTMHVSRLAAQILFSGIGYNPTDGSDALIEKNSDSAMKWLKDVKGGMGAVGLQGSAVGGPLGQSPSARPIIVSSSPRGFGDRGDGTASGRGCKGTGFGGGYIDD